MNKRKVRSFTRLLKVNILILTTRGRKSGKALPDREEHSFTAEGVVRNKKRLSNVTV